MIERRLRRQLDEVAMRYRRMRAATWLAVVWIGLATAGAILLSLNHNLGVYVRGETIVFAAIGGAATVLVLLLSWRVGRDPLAVARKIENKYPQLDARLLTAIEQRPELPDGRFGYLQQTVIQEALFHGYRNDWRYALPKWRYALALLACFVGAIAVVTSGVGLFRFIRPTELGVAPLLGLFREQMPSPARLVSVEPGDASVERGTSVLVLAKFAGQLPSECVLQVDDPQSSGARQLGMTQSLDDPIFGGRVAGVEQDFNYRVTFDGEVSRRYRITVFEYPALQTADAILDFPDYTSMETTTVQDVRHVTAVEGTQLTLKCKLNKPVAEATLVADDGETLELVADSAEPTIRTFTTTMVESRRLALHLVDDDGRENRQPPEFVLTVTPNQRPTLELLFPSHDVQVSPIEELQLFARLWDDFSLTRFGVNYQFGGNSEQEVSLGEAVMMKDKLTVDHVLAFEELGAEPNQLLTYYFWAEDVGPDGQTRRTMSDMFFAEVRHFEEIFRQGQQPPGGAEQQQQQQGEGPQSGAGQAQQLAEAQKEIINATWNLLRGGQTQGISNSFSDDVVVVRDSQSALIDQVGQLAQRLNDAQAQAAAAEVTQHMQEVVSELERAISEQSTDALQTALAPEQAAYQSLLRLRAREFQVIRSNQRNQQQSRGAGGGGASRSQQQLQQLALANDQNRYETQRQAEERQQGAQNEDRQILNRLRELARRQNDLNERLKELQAELEQAATEEEKEELLKQLKRLRDEQQEVLRDTDELNSRMNQQQNPSDNAEARQQLEQARENVRRTSEALEEGRLSQALTSGTRAQRELDELRDEFRKRTSDRFAEEARELKKQATELAETQREIGQSLGSDRQESDDQPPSLREPTPREQLNEDLARQNERLESLLERTQEAVRDAEEPQPLLAEQLYDSYRRARQNRLPEKLQETQRSVQRGFLDDAREVERSARQGIEQLRDEIDQAAESVLGDEQESLRRARDELDELAEQLQREINRADPQRDGRRPASEQDEASSADRNDQQEERSDQQSGRGNREEANEDRQRQGEGNQDRQADRPGEQQGDASGQGQRPQERDAAGQNADRSSQGRPDEARRGEEQPRAEGANAEGERPGEQPGDRQGSQPGSRGGENDRDGQRQSGDAGSAQRSPGDDRNALQAGGPGSRIERVDGPLTGDNFRQWSDRLRNVEEMVGDPELRSDVARVRDRAREVRTELLRHSQQPNWDLVRMTIARPLTELRDRIDEELQKRTSRKALVPIDRDPVPVPYVEQVRRYYEKIGSGK